MFVCVWSPIKKWLIVSILILWIISLILFYSWWFNPQHIGVLSGFIMTTIVISWPLLLFGYSFFFLIKMRKSNVQKPIPHNLRAAMIVTKAPCEPLTLIQETLTSALKQKYPHDTWIADEDPTPEALAWYKKNQVKVSTRKNATDYHNENWPRKKKCKEGNLAYFYDKYGYDNYDIVVQVDADHVLSENYLENILRPFNDPKIGYVSASSLGDANQKISWAARARMHAEALFHGPMQSGANAKWVPLCIGSHYALRTSALKQIGGIGPELAEDYSTTLLLNAAGWKGGWVYESEAHGQGPNSFGAVITQDYQWARSIMIIFLTIFPKVFFKLNWRQKIQFTLTQLWYPTSALIWTLSILIILFALLTGQAPAIVSFIDFLLYIVPPFAIIALLYLIIRETGYLRPQNGKFWAWENILFEFARWPWIALACLEAITKVIKKNECHENVVTSKNNPSKDRIPLKYIIPYLTIVFLLMLAIIIGPKTIELFGYYLFAFAVIIAYLSLSVVILIFHITEAHYENKTEFTTNHVPHLVSTLSSIATFVVIVAVTTYQFIVPINALNIIIPTEVKNQNYQPLITSPEQQPLELSSEIIIEHTVKSGDCLWRIAEKYYGDGRLWPQIYKTNKHLIENPNLIYPDQKFIIPFPTN